MIHPHGDIFQDTKLVQMDMSHMIPGQIEMLHGMMFEQTGMPYSMIVGQREVLRDMKVGQTGI